MVSITQLLFDDTDFPVCLALWTPEETDDFIVSINDNIAGTFKQIQEQTQLLKVEKNPNVIVRFNDPSGIVGVKAVDNTSGDSIRFVAGEEIDPSLVKHTSRSISRFSVVDKFGEHLVNNDNLGEIVEQLNQLLAEYRAESFDVFLTNFKSLRKDGKYRRRLDWNTAKLLVWKVFEEESSPLLKVH